MLTLKIKCQLFYQQRWVYKGITKNHNLGEARYGKTIGKSAGQSRELLSYRGNRDLRKTVVNKKSIGLKWELEVWWLLIG